MGRPKFSKAARAAVLARADNPRGVGNCWHCGVPLTEGYHLDHWPVRFVDIEGQFCCGVRNAKDRTNLVPTCPSCNQSHKFENTQCCGRSQCRCTAWATAVAMLTVYAAAATGLALWLASTGC